ncbi:LexA family protein [Dehalobacterium formicoaceticum]|uniref:LexA family protein n=1 Tax=Dehalobacterium formicoaceticum TaxID=51515 RepID=UPI000B7EB5EC|nr:LexA family transcriptional regulator [Dehalobacterium formicoaceticum]
MSKDSVGEVIKELRNECSYSQKELSGMLNIAQNTLSQYETGTREPDNKILIKIADFFNVSTDYLLGRTTPESELKKLSTLKIPVLGTIHAGLPVLAEDNWEYEIELSSEIIADYALRVKGDSMSWAGIHDGDLALMRQADAASHGMIVAAGSQDMDWEATLKYYIQENGHTLLRAANPAYADIKITNHRIIGHLVKVIKDAPSLSLYRDHLVNKQLADEGWTDAITTAVGMGFDPQNLKQQLKIIEMLQKK